MKKFVIKRWMLTASTIMILASSTGCSIKKNKENKCQKNHLDMFDVVSDGECYGFYYGNEKDFRRSIREKFFGKHNLITVNILLQEYPQSPNVDYERIFDEVKVGKSGDKDINDEALNDIYTTPSMLQFIDYIIFSNILEGKIQKDYFSKKDNEKIVEMFLSCPAAGEYELKGGDHHKGYKFQSSLSFPGLDLCESVIESVKNENFDCKKEERIRSTKSKNQNKDEITYYVNQKYQIIFYDEEVSYGDNKNIILKLNNCWEILNKHRLNEEYQCESYLGSLSLEYNGETIEAAVTEETYEEIAELIAIAVQNKNTKDEFLQQNGGILAEVLGDDYKNLKLGKAKVLKKGSKR